MYQIIRDIFYNHTRIKPVLWRGQTEDNQTDPGKRGEVLAYEKGSDVLLVKKTEEFITILKDGTKNGAIKRG